MLLTSLKLTVLMLWGSEMGIWDDFQKWMGGNKQQEQVAAPEQQPQVEQPKAPDYLERLKMAESSGKAEAKAATSSAAGHHQFVERTWKELTSKYGKNYTLDDRFNPEKSREIAGLYTEENRKALTNVLGSEPTDTQLYAAHFLGTTGAKKFLMASPKKLAKDVVDESQVKANKTIFYDSKTKKPRTVAQVYGLLQKKIGE